MNQPLIINGKCQDSAGNKKDVRVKRIWGEHRFTEDEWKRLSNGEVIRFIYSKGIVEGHFQFYVGPTEKKIFGFCPSFNEEYSASNSYTFQPGSSFSSDIDKEHMINKYMKVMLYSHFTNRDGSPVKIEYITDKKQQDEGLDVILEKDGKVYCIDEKAQLDYINNQSGPLNTFVLELQNSQSGKKGWFVNDNLKTDHYMFIWPHCDTKFRDIQDIEYVEYALVERARIEEELQNKGLSKDILVTYGNKLVMGELEHTEEKKNRVYYKQSPFSKDEYLVYTQAPTQEKSGKVEKPVNLVVRKKFLESISVKHGRLGAILN